MTLAKEELELAEIEKVRVSEKIGYQQDHEGNDNRDADKPPGTATAASRQILNLVCGF